MLEHHVDLQRLLWLTINGHNIYLWCNRNSQTHVSCSEGHYCIQVSLLQSNSKASWDNLLKCSEGKYEWETIHNGFIGLSHQLNLQLAYQLQKLTALVSLTIKLIMNISFSCQYTKQRFPFAQTMFPILPQEMLLLGRPFSLWQPFRESTIELP